MSVAIYITNSPYVWHNQYLAVSQYQLLVYFIDGSPCIATIGVDKYISFLSSKFKLRDYLCVYV